MIPFEPMSNAEKMEKLNFASMYLENNEIGMRVRLIMSFLNFSDLIVVFMFDY